MEKKEPPHDIGVSGEGEVKTNETPQTPITILEIMFNALDRKLDRVLFGMKMVVIFLIVEFFIILI
ncbi:hypothetical protein [Gracilibacillus salinarum]|uniref:Uncharacterized protein n=1 Tax=Gracilibacillus salinarum TaxID=2932255 RepID=A0ABY4GMQ1_9BACI|nr:hypothetical protein [Gracilibacillus salinarum]UOQ85658.1 hypothetical protein MUN87_01765 [Gracilibacillus salinarum]